MSSPDVPAGLVLQARLAQQVASLRAGAEAARRGEPEGVHETRLASRRLRAALGTFRKLFDRDATDPLRDELRWLGRQLSGARDAHVVHQRLIGLLDEEPGDDVTGAARERLEESFSARADEAEQEVNDALGSPRFTRLLADLDRLLAEPPWTPLADGPGADVLSGLVKRDWKRLRRTHAAVEDADDHDVAIHRVRKTAKRFRYAVETLEPLWPDEAGRLADAAHAVTDHLGERQDAVTARTHLDRLTADADATDASSTVWRALRTRDRCRIEDLDDELPDVWDGLARKRLRRWLR